MKQITTLLLGLLISTSVYSQTLKQLAESKNKYIGTAINNNYLDGNHNSNPNGYAAALESEFNCIVAENAFKMGYLLPNKPSDPFHFTIADFDNNALNRIDAMLNLAETKNMRVRGHAYIWYNQAPQWLKNDAPNWTDQQVFDFAEAYITALGTYTKGKVDEWDVVNEAINDDETSNYRTADTWYAGVSSIQNFIDHCFNVAKTVDPNSDTYYNDYNIETKYHGKNAFMLSMVEEMKNRGVTIDGVGLQSHFTSGEYTNTNVVNEIGITIDKIGDLGLFAVISELDLRICGGTTQAALDEQKDEYKEIAQMFLTKENCKSLLVWGISDNGSWIPYTFDGCDDALLYDDNMNKKPSYSGVFDALNEKIVIIDPNDHSPYSGTPTLIPGTIETEHYDLGNNGVAYFDNTTGNEGGELRNDDVDIAGTGDQGSGYVIGWGEQGEYLKYTIDIESSEDYDFTFRVATPLGGGEFNILIDEEYIIEHVTIDVTGTEWEDYINVIVEDIPLTEGDAVLTLEYISGGFNFSNIQASRKYK